MKKIIALALALVLSLSMATVAFAAEPWAAKSTPGESYQIASTVFVDGTDTPDADYLTNEYYSLSYKIAKGKELVESVKFDGEGNVEVTFKANYELTEPKIDNVIFSELKVKAIKAHGSIVRNTTFTAPEQKTKVGFVDGTNMTEIDDSTTSLSFDADGTLYKVKGATKDITINGDATDVYVEVRVYDGDKFYLKDSAKANKDIVKANPDADMTFVSFTGAPTFTSSAYVEFSADEDTFIYEIKDGKLLKTNFKYDKDLLAFTGKTRTLGAYVISDVELKSAVKADDETKNPNTGANDFVGVAVALAVVSLVAAGAVSLKK